MTLAEARDLLRTLVPEGHRCPCCTQYAKVYRRKAHSGMARSLIVMWRHDPHLGWFYKPDVLRGVGAAARDESLLRYWGLVEEDPAREDDGRRAGWWRVTDLGASWVNDEVRIQKYALVYDGRCLSLTGDLVAIRNALGDRFNYSDLMAGV